MKFETVVVGPLAVNSYVIYDEETRDCVIIDPGEEGFKIIETISTLNLNPKEIWLTHAHFDHLGGIAAVTRKYDVTVFLHSEDYFLYKTANEHAIVFGFDIETPNPDPSFFNMKIGTKKIGSFTIDILHTPGHSPGGVSFYNKERNIVFTGDLIFDHSVGRTDVPGGSFEDLESSIQKQIYTLGDDCVIYPGHGPKTSVGREKKQNPFVRFKG